MTELTEQGYVARSEMPDCPECGYTGHHRIADTGGGLRYSLRCGECDRILTRFSPVETKDREEIEYGAIAQGIYGKGDTIQEAKKNLQKQMDEDEKLYYKVYAGSPTIGINRYGEISAERVLHIVERGTITPNEEIEGEPR